MSKIHELAFNAEEIDELLDSVDKKTIYQDATQSEHGLMSSTDKTKLDALPTAQQIDSALNAKVDKVEGKGLSENDYTDAEKASVASAYQKPQNGIPKTDLSSNVQASLNKADTAIQEHQDISGKADKSETYTKSEVDAKVVSVMRYKGSVNNYAALSAIQNPSVGDVYNVLDTGHNYAYDGTSWDVLSGIVSVDGKADKVNNATNGNFAGLDANGNLTDSGKKASDFATASQGVKADTALQPTGVKTINNQSIVGSGNIMIEGGGTDDYADLDNKPQINSVALSGNKTASDLGLATAVQGAKADTAVQQVTVGTTTTGAAGTNASVTNRGTSTAPVFDFTIPRGTDGHNPNLGSYTDVADAPTTNLQDGDYIVVLDTTQSPVTGVIYTWNGSAWQSTGRDANMAYFGSGELLADVHIDDTNLVNPVEGALPTAADVMQLKVEVGSLLAQTVEDGFFIVDENLNVGAAIDNDGIHLKNIVEFETIE